MNLPGIEVLIEKLLPNIGEWCTKKPFRNSFILATLIFWWESPFIIIIIIIIYKYLKKKFLPSYGGHTGVKL